METKSNVDFKHELVEKLKLQTEAFSIIELLRECFFTQKENRSLVLQHIDNYAVFFMEPGLFDWNQEKNKQVSQLWDLVYFIQKLKANGAIHSVNGLEREQNIEVIYSSYTKVILDHNKVTFSQDGDYSIEPHTILDREGQVKFKGIVYRGDYYYALLESLSGVFVKSVAFDAVLKGLDESSIQHKDSGKNQSQKRGVERIKSMLTIGLMVLVLIASCFTLMFSYGKFTDVQSQLDRIKTSQDSIAKFGGNIEPNLTSAGASNNRSRLPISDPTRHSTQRLFGIDISHYQGDIVSEIELSDSISFIICKATQGQYYVDPYFKSNWSSLKQKGITRGAYHFYEIGKDSKTQAAHFLSTVEEYDQGDISLIVDIEMLSLPKNVQRTSALVDSVNTNLLKFLSVLEEKTKKVPIVYTSNAFANEYLVDSRLSRYPLWLAEYTKAQNPRIPHVWKDQGFKIWQRSDNYSIESHHSDLDVFYGSKEDLVH